MSDAEVAATVFAEVDGILSEVKQRSQNRTDDPGLARAVQIVERCVVGREQWKAVARELGISNRQYARDKAQIVAMITRSLLARSAVHSNSQVQCVMTAALNSCIALSERGGGNAAVERLFEMAADSRTCRRVSQHYRVHRKSQLPTASSRLPPSAQGAWTKQHPPNRGIALIDAMPLPFGTSSMASAFMTRATAGRELHSYSSRLKNCERARQTACLERICGLRAH